MRGRRRLFRLFVIIGCLIVAVLFTALIAPYFVNWQNHKGTFEREVSRILGQPVRVLGDPNLRILPLPTVSFNGLEVGKNPDGTALMTVERFTMNAELMPFLSGEIRIVDMAMFRPVINLQVAENGTIAWTDRREPLVNPQQVKIEKLSVRNGRVNVTGLAGGREFNFDNVNAEVSARSIIGPWKIGAVGELDNILSSVNVTTGTLQDDGSLGVKMDISQENLPYKLSLNGPVSLKEDILAWDGDFKINVSGSKDENPDVRDKRSLPIFAEGVFNASPQLISVREYRLEVGKRDDPYTIVGAGKISIAENVSFALNADGRQINLDKLKTDNKTQITPSVETRLATLRSILERIPVPGVEGEITVSLPAVVVGDTFVRDVKSIMHPFGRGWRIEAFSALFPGNTKLEANGRLGLREDFGFHGNLLVASRQPSGFASWISGDVVPAIRRLKQVGFASRVEISERQATFEEIELRLDKALLLGKIQRLAAGNSGRAGIVADLSGKQINVDDLLALYSLAQSKESPGLTNHDLDIKVNAGVLEGSFKKQVLRGQNVDGHIRIQDGKLSIERLNVGDFVGVNIKSTGRIENLLESPNGNLKLSVHAPDIRALLGVASDLGFENHVTRSLQAESRLTKNAALAIELDTTAANERSKGQALLSGLIGGTSIDWSARFERGEGLAEFSNLDLSGTASNSDTEILMRQLGVDTIPLAAPGPLTITLDAIGNSKAGFEAQVTASAQQTSLNASGTVQLTDLNIPDLAGKVTLSSTNLVPYLFQSGVSVPGIQIEDRLPVSLSFDLEHEKNVTRVRNLAGQVSGRGFSGDFEQVQEIGSNPTTNGNLKLEEISLASVLAPVLGSTGKTGSITGQIDDAVRWPVAEYGLPYLEGRNAKIKLSVDRLKLGNVSEANDLASTVLVQNGAVQFEDLHFKTLGGNFSGGMDVKNNQGLVLGELRYSLENAEAEQVAQLFERDGIVSGTVSASGSIEVSGRSAAALVSSASGSGSFVLDEPNINGLNSQGFDEILERVDVESFEINPENVRQIISDVVLVGDVKPSRIETAFTINRGKLSVRNVALETPDADLGLSAKIDLVSGELALGLDMRHEPGKEKVSGADPDVRFNWYGSIEKPKLEIDTNALESYLSLRAFERNQRRIETLEANAMEKQRYRMEAEFQLARLKFVERKEEEERKAREEELRRLLEAEEARRAEEAAAELARQQKLLEEKQKNEQIIILEELPKIEQAKPDQSRLKLEGLDAPIRLTPELELQPIQ